MVDGYVRGDAVGLNEALGDAAKAGEAIHENRVCEIECVLPRR